MLDIHAIKITPDILLQISDIDEFKGLWTGLDRHTTGLNLLSDVASHGAKFAKMLKPLHEKPLTPEVIGLINFNQTGDEAARHYKTEPNQLPISKQDVVFGTLDTAEPAHVAPLIAKLCDWVNEELDKGQLHPLLIAAVFSSVFLQCCPFDVGNMRTMRFLVMLIMLKSDYAYVPYVSMTTIMETRAEQVFTALKHNQDSLEEGKPDWSAWVRCFLSLLQDQKDALHARLYAQETDLKNMPKLSTRIMGLFKDHKRLQMKEIITLTNGRRATIKLRLGELLDGGYLVRHGAGRSTWYALV